MGSFPTEIVKPFQDPDHHFPVHPLSTIALLWLEDQDQAYADSTGYS